MNEAHLEIWWAPGVRVHPNCYYENALLSRDEGPLWSPRRCPGGIRLANDIWAST